MVEGNPVGKIVYQGLGAGKGPTTSSVVLYKKSKKARKNKIDK